MSEDHEPTLKRKLTAKAGLAPFTVTYEAEWLADATQRLHEEFTADKRDELFSRIQTGAGNSDTLRAQAELSYFLTMLQVTSQERATRGLSLATWILAAATVALVAATTLALFLG